MKECTVICIDVVSWRMGWPDIAAVEAGEWGTSTRDDIVPQVLFLAVQSSRQINIWRQYSCSGWDGYLHFFSVPYKSCHTPICAFPSDVENELKQSKC